MIKSLAVVLFMVGLCATVHAATLQNRDFRQYHLRVQYPNGRVGRIIVAGGSSLPGFCSYDGCVVTILETRDSAVVGPNDSVEIFYGRLQVRQSLF